MSTGKLDFNYNANYLWGGLMKRRTVFWWAMLMIISIPITIILPQPMGD